MDKKSKEALRRYKKSRQQKQSSSDSSSSSDSDSSSSSYTSSSDGKRAERHRKKKARQAAVAASSRRSSSSSAERRKREKREHACQKKLEAKRNHLKRKLKEAKLKKRAAAAAAAVISGHSHRSLSPATQAKLKKLAERKHQRASKEHREREREKHRAARGERSERERHVRDSRSPTKITKIRIHQDVKPRVKSPTHVHHQLMSREKIIIQTRTRDRTPSAEQRHEHKVRHHDHDGLRDRERRDRERAEREAARDKERAEALARCQERQRERERIAREKLRREEEDKKYVAAGLVSERERERLLPRPAERELAIATARGYNSRERSLEAVERMPRHASQRELELYERERDFLEAERRGLLDREELRREREYLAARRREMSPISEHYAARLREERDLYEEEERERAYSRAYLEEGRHPRERDAWLDQRELRDRELRGIRDVRELRELEQLRELYPNEREHLVRERERERSLAVRGDWKKEEWPPAVIERSRGEWDDAAGSKAGFIGGPVRSLAPTAKVPPREKRAPSEPDWDADEAAGQSSSRDAGSSRGTWDERELVPSREKHSTSRAEHGDRRWPTTEWRDGAAEVGPSAGRGGDGLVPSHHLHREARLQRGFRRGGHQDHGERNPAGGASFRSHAPPALMTLPVQPPGSTFHAGPPGAPRFPSKRNMTYTNPNLIKKQQAALAAAKAAAQASAVAAATTAVAAAKAAAQSAANATTNPVNLGQIGGLPNRQPESAAVVANTADKPEAGEIVGDTDSATTTSEPEITARTPAEALAEESKSAENANDDAAAATTTSKASGELSEISDSDDDILDKEPAKAVTPPPTAIASSEDTKNEDDSAAPADNSYIPNEPDKPEEEDLLDFEEISDGELEEDARNKGVGDALGVDWASLIAETKRQAANANPQDGEETTTAKQKWQPHRILLDVGISMHMAGESYAKQLLKDAKQKLEEELGQLKVKSEIKEEVSSTTTDEDSHAMDIDKIMNTKSEDKAATPTKSPLKTMEGLDETNSSLDVERMHPIASIQVAERIRGLERRTLIANACGSHSRALSARQDLKLRRQLCGLPARECDLPRPLIGTSSAMKAKALAAFQRTFEVKSF